MQFPPDLLRSCWFLAGPTACGKSEVALELAATLNAEIVAMDSMSVYRGMDVGTAKPSPAARARVPHHLIDIVEPQVDFSLADYLLAAEASCRDIAARGKTPLFVGGTGLYLRGLLRGVFDGPRANWALRRRLQEEADRHEPGYLHVRLREVDPASAQAIHPHDTRRLIRALEVYHVTGRRLSAQHTQDRPLPPSKRPRHVYWLSPPRDWLREQINRRVVRMIAGGLVLEARRLLAAERPISRTARQALGYKEIFDFLEGSCTLETAIETIQVRTRQFAKRQHTWFRHLEECTRVEMTGRESAAELAQKICLASTTGG